MGVAVWGSIFQIKRTTKRVGCSLLVQISMAYGKRIFSAKSRCTLSQLFRTPFCTSVRSANRSWSSVIRANVCPTQTNSTHSSHPVCHYSSRSVGRFSVTNSSALRAESEKERKFFPRRAVMYVPASDERKTKKAATLSVDTLVFDLEDGVAANQKAG